MNRVGLSICVLIVGAVVTACVGSTESSSSSTATPSGCKMKAGYDVTLPSSIPGPPPYGAKTPDDAVKSTQWPLPAEYGSANTVWTTAASSPSRVELASDHAEVVVVQLSDKSWIVHSATGCTSNE